ncbi:hypothetical protein GCM10010112_08850 [Actinoplanes lobatus]|uniref:DUF397 domain-containing protein n=1 Tax=Actinoplanes lobatus TaxID=113568 RepID=A0A7W7HD47_9ACTN|nr:DUF397 domain-containing protein [Actinoplanes lobatus]MBB4748349.1 hypothetical protein [Actinoplanes lobatus]GGN56743.1 hypothetical protein GCM10010112_08850 [Actinoplanes lobatus]GIE37747.1 hypothetical protein Alo02nite_06450 [Actinoplanes lobatus]
MGEKTYAETFDADAAEWLRSGGPAGEFVEISRLPDGGAAMRNSTDPATILFFTKGEWDAFTGGVHDGEFDLPES